MIKAIKIENFKSHLKTDIKLSNLNILAGVNGMGKSSLIQALLLLRQSFQKTNLAGLELNNADLCKIGNISDAISNSAEENIIRIEILETGNELKFSFPFTELDLNKTYIPNKTAITNDLNKINLFNSNFQYLSAFRNGPSDEFTSDTFQVEYQHQISIKEGRGEMLAHYIDYFGNKEIPIATLCHTSTSDLALKTQIECWLREFSKNINLHISKTTDTNYKIEYSFNRENKLTTTRFKAKNVGFGLTYDLPILTAILSAKPDDLIIIENPEAHIHPSGQSKLMELISNAAESGVQFIIETHSDHIINGALVATKNDLIKPENISIYYFERDEEKHFTKPIYLEVLKNGKISKPPKGFFDQIDADLEILMGF